MGEYNSRQLIKRRFYAMRNGLLADQLRRAGSPYKIIFGLNVPQLKEIAAEFAGDAGLLEFLRGDVRCRESRLIAPMLADVSGLTAADAAAWLASAESLEEADILSHSLLRRHPQAARIAVTVLSATLCAGAKATPLDLKRYGALRLLGHLPASSITPEITDAVIACAEQGDAATNILCNNILANLK